MTRHTSHAFATASSSTFADYESAARFVRARLGVKRLTPALADEVRAAVTRHADRQYARASATVPTGADRRELLRRQVQSTVAPLLDRLFKSAQSSWAGGETSDQVTISATPRASGATVRAWSSNGKWSGNNLHRHVSVMPAWRKHVQTRAIATLDGMLTTHATLVRSLDGIEIYAGSWVRQGRGYDLASETGHIAYHRPWGTAYHLVGGDPAKAAAGLRRKLNAQAIPADERDRKASERAARKAARQAGQMVRLIEKLSRWELDDVAHVVVRREDSLRAGNCKPGTDAFADRYFDGAESATIGEIARAVGRIDPANLSGDALTFARQLAAACLVAVRRDRQAARALQLS